MDGNINGTKCVARGDLGYKSPLVKKIFNLLEFWGVLREKIQKNFSL